MRNPLPRPRRRRTPEFEALVDQIYRMMTQRDDVSAAPSAQPGGAAPGTLGDSPLPQASVDGLSGLAEILHGRHQGAADLADLADSLGLAVDDLLPLVDALVLLGFADLCGDVLALSPSGRIFAGASIQDSKEIFARASLDRAPLVRTIFRALRGSADGNLPAGFFTDILRPSFGAEEAARQLNVAVNWGRYAELYAYDASSGQIIREDHGIGTALAAVAEPARRGALHLYLGAAPGSGKTFTMLREGRALRDRGEDVVIGFVQPHGRPRTAATGPRRRPRLPGLRGRLRDHDRDARGGRAPPVARIRRGGRRGGVPRQGSGGRGPRRPGGDRRRHRARPRRGSSPASPRWCASMTWRRSTPTARPASPPPGDSPRRASPSWPRSIWPAWTGATVPRAGRWTTRRSWPSPTRSSWWTCRRRSWPTGYGGASWCRRPDRGRVAERLRAREARAAA